MYHHYKIFRNLERNNFLVPVIKSKIKRLAKQIGLPILWKTIGSHQYNKTRKRKVRQKDLKGKNKAVSHCGKDNGHNLCAYATLLGDLSQHLSFI